MPALHSGDRVVLPRTSFMVGFSRTSSISVGFPRTSSLSQVYRGVLPRTSGISSSTIFRVYRVAPFIRLRIRQHYYGFELSRTFGYIERHP